MSAPVCAFGFPNGVATTQSGAVGIATANFQVTGAGGGPGTVRIANVGNNVAFIAFGNDNTVTAALATSCPILPNTVETFDVAQASALWVASIAAAAGNTLYATFGASA